MMEPTALVVESCCVRRLCSTTPDVPVGAGVSDSISILCLVDSLAVMHTTIELGESWNSTQSHKTHYMQHIYMCMRTCVSIHAHESTSV